MARGTAPPLNPTLLRDARSATRMSQRDLARAVGTTRHQIIRYENGAERPEIARLAALARACSVTVADLLDEDALPPGLAGLRIGAGLTMAAAATALGEHIDPSTGIATNRASLSGAEKGRLPLSWRLASAGSRVRGAMAATYEVDIDAVRSAWQATFPDTPHRPPAPREEVDQGESEAGSLNATSDYIGDVTPATDHGQEIQETAQSQEAPGVAVLVSGGPQSAQVYMDGDYVGHLEHRHSWDQQSGWTYRVRLTDTDRTHMSPGHQDAPDAVTSLTDIAAALPVLLEEAHGHPVPIADLSGERTDLPIRARDMERWELRRGRVSGREDIYVRSRCWGWLQPVAPGGFTAHTVEGPVPGAPAPTREDAAAALWAHLTSPLPPPSLGARARTRRRLRSHAKLARPMCPYSPTELARVSVVEAPASKTGARLYQAVAPDGVVLGFLWRSGRGWSRCAPTPQGTMPGSLPVGASFPSRAEALESLLSRPGPLWGDPAEVIVH